jgi:hypothetical protein
VIFLGLIFCDFVRLQEKFPHEMIYICWKTIWRSKQFWFNWSYPHRKLRQVSEYRPWILLKCVCPCCFLTRRHFWRSPPTKNIILILTCHRQNTLPHPVAPDDKIPQRGGGEVKNQNIFLWRPPKTVSHGTKACQFFSAIRSLATRQPLDGRD